MAEEKKAEKNEGKIVIKLPKFNLWILVSLVLAITLVLSLIQGWSITGKATGTMGTLSAAQAGQKTIDYINKNLVQPGTSATFLSIKDLGNVYEVTSSYQGREIPIYISKDGSFLFLSAYNTSETIEQEQETQQQVTTSFSDEELKEIGGFMECLADAGVKIYGANWCGYTKQLVENLGGFQVISPIYIECTEQSDICNSEGIQGYPTIKINGQQVNIERTISGFAKATGCQAPNVGVQTSSNTDVTCG